MASVMPSRLLAAVLLLAQAACVRGFAPASDRPASSDVAPASERLVGDGRTPERGSDGPRRPASCDGVLPCRDPRLGQNGVLLLDLGGVDNLGWSSEGVVEQPDGRLVVVGRGGSDGALDYLVIRLLEDGLFDPALAGRGWVLLDLGDAEEEAKSVSLLADGRITVAGTSGARAGFARLLPDGSPDPSFGASGLALPALPSLTKVSLNGHRIQPDGKIVASGHAVPGAHGWDQLLLRLLPGGALDPTFGGGAGWVLVDFLVGDDFANAPRLLTDGSILHAGSAWTGAQHFDVTLARATPGGAPDPGFGIKGRVTTDLGKGQLERGSTLLVLPSGAILVVGHGNSDIDPRPLLLRYNASGALDASFGTAGVAELSPLGRGALRSLLLLPDGRILVAGARHNGHDDDMLIAYLLPSGELDTRVGGGTGFQVIDASPGRADEVDHAILDRRGRLLLFGKATGPGGDADLALCRLWPD